MYKVETEKRSGVVYQIPCKDCDQSYIGQTGRQLEVRIKEHKSTAPSRKPSAVAEHKEDTKHTIDWKAVKIVDKEDRAYPRLVREAIQIRKLKPELNRDQGLELPNIYSALIRPNNTRSTDKDATTTTTVDF